MIQARWFMPADFLLTIASQADSRDPRLRALCSSPSLPLSSAQNSLASYYDEVALKGLQLAEADAPRDIHEHA